MTQKPRKTALVTGASSGLGAEFCRQLAGRCETIVAVARRREQLRRLADELAGEVDLQPLVADLCTVEGVARTLEALRQQGPVDYLVNNAGLSTFGQFAELGIDRQRDMLYLHADATITLCRAAVPFMRERGGGCIINVSSLGGLVPVRGGAVYGATKAFINYFSQVLQQELVGTGIEVQALCPGYVCTEFHADMADSGFDRERIPPEMWSDAPEVVAASLAALGGGRVVVVPGDAGRAAARAALQQQLTALE